MGIFISKKEYDVDDNVILQSGYLEKESRHKKEWRSRYTILTTSKSMRYKSIYTFKQNLLLISPTESLIDLNEYEFKHNGEYFSLTKNKLTFIFRCKNNQEAQQWVDKISDNQNEPIQPPIQAPIQPNKEATKNIEKKKTELPNQAAVASDSDVKDNQHESNNNNVFDDIEYKSCDSIKTCKALNRIVSMLKHYQNDPNGFVDDVYSSTKHFINDYHHILCKHLDGENDEENYEFIYQHISDMCVCQITSCQCLSRKYDHEQVSIYQSIIDTIHCYFMHSYDIGCRIRNRMDTTQPLPSYSVTDDQMKLLEKIHGTELMQHNKFKTEFKLDNNDEKKDCEAEFSFGYFFNYWDLTKKDCVQKKYDTIKTEITNNKCCPLKMERYDKAYNKAVELSKCDKLKIMKSTKRADYGFDADIPLDIEHLLTVILYTDEDILSFKFSETFRMIHSKETIEEIRNRNSEFYHLSKFLRETVDCFGERVHESKISSFYHGISMVYIGEFIAQFGCPLSTTTQLGVAANFAGMEGLILELQQLQKQPCTVRYFDCRLVSSFAHEEERLIYSAPGGFGIQWLLAIKSIRYINKINDQFDNYEKYIKAIYLLKYMIWSFIDAFPDEFIQRLRTAEHYEIISNLIKVQLQLINEGYKNEYPHYINRCFAKWCGNQEIIHINLKLIDIFFECKSSDDSKENDVGFGTCIKCVCGNNLIKTHLIKTTVNWDKYICVCDKCELQCSVKTNVYRCGENSNLHPNGYDICEQCIMCNSNVLNSLFSLDKIVLLFKNCKQFKGKKMGEISTIYLSSMLQVLQRINENDNSKLTTVILDHCKVTHVSFSEFVTYQSLFREQKWELSIMGGKQKWESCQKWKKTISVYWDKNK